MLELPGPPLILQVFSMRMKVEHELAPDQDVKGAFVGLPFLVSKNQNWTFFGLEFPSIMERDLSETSQERKKEGQRDLCSFKSSSHRNNFICRGKTTPQACLRIYACQEKCLHNPYVRVSMSLPEVTRVMSAPLMRQIFNLRRSTNQQEMAGKDSTDA